MPDALIFILAPDADAGRRLRRYLATRSSRIGLRVGTWLELLDELRNAYLIQQSSGWEEALHTALASRPNAFWHQSYQLDPAGVAQSVAASWRLILEAHPPSAAWPIHDGNERIASRLKDLACLNELSHTKWPEDLAVAADLYSSDAKPIRPIRVIPMDWGEVLTPWQTATIERINADNATATHELNAELDSFLKEINTAGAKQGSQLRAAQDGLGGKTDHWPDADGSCKLLGIRDELECIEVAASLIQRRLQEDPALKPCDFGIVIPQGFEHAERMERLFKHCGLPLSNLSSTVSERDLGHELLRFALMHFEGLAPSMAVQALVSNPLMPWPLESGRLLANTLTDFGFSLKARHLQSKQHRELLALFGKAVPIERVPEALAKLLNALNTDPALVIHRQRACDSGQRILDAIQAGERCWDALRQLVPTRNFSTPAEQVVTQEGICIVAEGRLPLRAVQHLLILGFSQGHYPQGASSPPVFSADEWRTLQAAGMKLQLPTQQTQTARLAFKRQLRQASDSLTILIPQLSSSGSLCAPSSSLLDFALLANKADSPEDIVLDLEREGDRRHVAELPIAPPQNTRVPKPIEAQDIRFDINLLAAYEAANEQPHTLSPSTLDSLLVSPLAWLLKQLGAEPKAWAPDQFDPLTNGSIAHEVFELLFPQDCFEPDVDALRAQFTEAFERGVRQISPFLSASEWAVERNHLRGICERAVQTWAETMGQLKARLIQPEISLKGRFDGIAISGRADAVMDVPDIGAVVVDYKNAGSSRFLTRMEREFDLQTVLYREMLKTGGPKETEGNAAERLRGLKPTGVMYFAMQDGQAVADFEAPTILGNWRFAGREVSTRGLAKLRERFAELRRGEVRAPRESEINTFKKSGVGLYALDTSPLTAVLHPDDGEEA